MTNKQLAKAIVQELMTVYWGTRRDEREFGTRLAIMQGKAGVAERNLGGLCKAAAEERVLRILDAKRPEKAGCIRLLKGAGKEQSR